MRTDKLNPSETQIPLMWALDDDFELRAVMISLDDTIQSVARQLASFSVGRTVRGGPDDSYAVRVQGHDDALSPELTVRSAGLRPWDCVELSKSGKIVRTA
jgi:hypothetical protein